MIFWSGISLLLIGMIGVYAKDLLWEFTERQNRLKGLASERTPEWDTAAGIGGVIALILGVVMLFINFLY